ncbi:MAG: MFS transporter [Bacteroidales bacterium]|nr:MFS transporter [Bacteroidales bacterium]
MTPITRNTQYFKFCAYGFLKNLRFFEAFLILFLIEKGMSFTNIGILYAIKEIVINMLEIPSGIIADSYGRKSSLVGSFIFYIISFVLFFFANNFIVLALAFVLYGVGDAFRSGTHKGMIMDYLKLNGWTNQKINYYGHTRSWSQIGTAVSALFAGVLVFYSGAYNYIFVFSIVPYLINIVNVASYPTVLDFSEQTKKRGDFVQTFKDFIATIRNKKVLKLINSSALHTAYLGAVKDYIQPLMVSVIIMIPLFTGVDQVKKSGLFVGVFYFVIYMLTSGMSKLSGSIEYKSKRNLAFITLLIGFGAGVISGLLYLNSYLIFATIAFVAIFMFENLRKPILTGYVADNVDNSILTSVISAQSQLKTVITAILALLFGLLADYIGIGGAMVAISATLFVASIVIRE